ncbi:hypothetical protein BpHYR1_043328 [Brachionus plicatilis]|uniref:Uncharacterized protein n=1 Tax=Brachionus plicatilis TaxID=10195 RepID=A0A3M7QHJ2_BRAPC|nr:hypothetical protein BpHYR1_043328 [Brachionus plicatilis]
MKKDDIIKQKLFETCNLSNFYLDYIIECKWEDESPMHLANCYKQKLYEIADKYDRMLEADRQREQLYLSLDRSARFGKNLTSTSTPNKSKSTCSSHATTPTTPTSERAFVRSASASSHMGRRVPKSHKKLTTLEQRIHSIYYDEFEQDHVEHEYRCEASAGDLFNEDEFEMDYQEDLDPAITNLNQHIEKSYSNLSKDSGVLIDSYHSDYSNCVYNPDRSKGAAADTTHMEHDSDSVSPSSNEEDEEVKMGEEERDQIAPILPHNLSLKKIFNSKMENRRLHGSSQTPGYSLFNSKFYQDQYKTYTKSLLNKKLSNLAKKNANLNLDLDSTNLMSLVVDERNTVIPHEANDSNSSLCSTSSTPSPSSTSSAETNEYEFNYKASPSLNSCPSVNSIDQPMTNSLIKSTNPLFFNYNSLMNASMLDSIQIANNSLETDMSSSILMFN